jgi:DMSO reductase anchor subunit
VAACPEGAIRIEIVDIDEWRAEAGTTLRDADGSLSTTRITVPAELPPNARPTDLTHVRPADPHWPLIVMTVLTQLSAGAFVTTWLLHLMKSGTDLRVAALMSLLVAGLALSASTLHLGRPVHAYRALRMWKRSWLSREVLLFSAFSAAAAVYAAALWLGPGPLAGSAAFIGGLTALLGLAGVTASACIYRVRSRPAWNSRFTVLYFLMTSAVLGPLFVAMLGAGDSRWLGGAAAAGAAAQLLLLAFRFFRLIAHASIELKGTARLLSTTLRARFVGRAVLLAVGGVIFPLVGLTSIALPCALAGELLGRYLFFVSVVPKHMTTPYLAVESEAA